MRICSFGVRLIGRVATAAMLLLVLSGLPTRADAGEPFGRASVLEQGPLAATWRALQAQTTAEQSVIARCRTAPSSCSSTPALRFIAIVDEGKAFGGLARIGHINRAVNFALRPLDVRAADARQERWTTPLAALAAGEGDCKQFAVLKYAALRAAGFASDDVRVVIMGERRRPETHAMVAVRNGARWLVLDNRSLAIVESRTLLDRYRPLYTLGRDGVRRFVPQPQVAAHKAAAACGG